MEFRKEYNKYIKVVAGVDVPEIMEGNEADFKENEWCKMMMALGDLIDLVTGEMDLTDIERIHKNSIQELIEIRERIMSVECSQLPDD